MKRLLLVANPRSGSGALKTKLMGIVEVFTKAGYLVTVHTTRFSRDAENMVRQVGGDFDLVVACGGDGTINEVVTGICQLERHPVLGVVPCGSTNDYASTLGLPRTPIAAAKALVEGEVFQSDTGYFNGRPFAYCAAFGLFTDITYQTPQDLKNAIGNLAYGIQAVKNIGSCRKSALRLSCPELETEGEFLLGMVTNTVSIGGFRRAFETVASLDDGKLEITLVRQPRTLEDVQMAINVLLSVSSVKGEGEFVTMVNTASAVIESDQPIPWTVDGEDGGAHTRVEISIKPGNIPVIRAKKGAVYTES